MYIIFMNRSISHRVLCSVPGSSGCRVVAVNFHTILHLILQRFVELVAENITKNSSYQDQDEQQKDD